MISLNPTVSRNWALESYRILRSHQGAVWREGHFGKRIQAAVCGPETEARGRGCRGTSPGCGAEVGCRGTCHLSVGGRRSKCSQVSWGCVEGYKGPAPRVRRQSPVPAWLCGYHVPLQLLICKSRPDLCAFPCLEALLVLGLPELGTEGSFQQETLRLWECGGGVCVHHTALCRPH